MLLLFLSPEGGGSGRDLKSAGDVSSIDWVRQRQFNRKSFYRSSDINGKRHFRCLSKLSDILTKRDFLLEIFFRWVSSSIFASRIFCFFTWSMRGEKKGEIREKLGNFVMRKVMEGESFIISLQLN